MSVELLGYSERGIVNAICEDIRQSNAPHSRLAEFLSWFDFQEAIPQFSEDPIRNAELLVEQSFSDFGDLDLLILIETQSGQKLCFLIEAKVSTDTNSWQTVNDRWKEFTEQLVCRMVNTSNLFVQLHRKVRLIEKLRAENEFMVDHLVPRGNTGSNRVVRTACEKLKGYLEEEKSVWFGAILPDTRESLRTFSGLGFGKLPEGNGLPTWNVERWGMLSWHTVNNACVETWPRTKATLKWNEGQIFRQAPPVKAGIQASSFALHLERLVYVVEAGMLNCRVILLDDPDSGHFPKTCKVPVSELAAAVEIPLMSVPERPIEGSTYIWESRNEIPVLPEGDFARPLADGSRVIVERSSWFTTRVRLSHGPDDNFLVFTHQLRRQQAVMD